MLWIEIGSLVLIGIVVSVVATVTKRPVKDLGSLSTHWVAQHRADR